MRILHYSLGLPPYRSGGLTKFCMDLILQQKKDGHEVMLMWPGRMRCVYKGIGFKETVDKRYWIRNFEIINPLPVSYDEGIVKIDAFMSNKGSEAYNSLIDTCKPDIIHIHTLMGLHKSFVEVAKNRNIKIVFSAHDFFPICPKVTMFRNGEICRSIESCLECESCNRTALDLKKIYLLQSRTYRCLKDSYVVKKLRKNHRDNYLKNTIDDLDTDKKSKTSYLSNTSQSSRYKGLRDYYYSMLKMMDVIHYNSNVTRAVYERIFNLFDGCLINISHKDIADHRKEKTFSDEKIRIRYLGPAGGAKGFFY